MTAEERDQRISEVLDEMETGAASVDDFWDAVFPSLGWCDYELKQLGFHGDYGELYKIVETANSDNDSGFPRIPEQALAYRATTPETNVLEHDERVMLRIALCYRNYFVEQIYFPEDGTSPWKALYTCFIG